MNAAGKLAGYTLGVAALFGVATGVGSAVGPFDQPAIAEHDESGHSAGSAEETAAADAVGGLTVSQDGYALALTQTSVVAADEALVSFQITGPDGAPVVDYTEAHDEDLHLVAVRRDMAGYQHVHPTLADDGTWSVPLDLGAAGEWRIFADFTPTDLGDGLTLGADLSVAGSYEPVPLPEPSRTATVDEYEVTLTGDLVPGQESELTLSVRRDGAPVTDLQPYLAAYGHLVVLRDGDLAYLHVHPAGEPGDGATEPGPDVTFYATAPSTGTYRLFLDFQHADVVRTAEFTVTTGESNDGQPAQEAGDDHGHD